jgi:nucleotide-binding universal stress UspA family protein
VSTHPHAHPVLVGIDDSLSGRAALEVGIRLAQQDHAPLSLVRVWRDVDWFLSARADHVSDLIADKHAEQATFAGACAHARTAAPELEVDGDFAPGSIYAVLLDRSESARVLVLGTSTSADWPGTIGTWYLEHARCPVVVVAPNGATAATSDGVTTKRLASHG